MMIKHPKNITVICESDYTSFENVLGAINDIPFIYIHKGTRFVEGHNDTQEGLILRFQDKESFRKLFSCLQTIKDEMDRFEPIDQIVS